MYKGAMNEDPVSDAPQTSSLAISSCPVTTTSVFKSCGETQSIKGYFIASGDGQNFVQVTPDSIKNLLAQQYSVYYVDEVADPMSVEWYPSDIMITNPSSSLFLGHAQPTGSVFTDPAIQQLPSRFQTEISSVPAQAAVSHPQDGLFSQLNSSGVQLSNCTNTNADNSANAVPIQAPVRSRHRKLQIRICPVCGIRFPSNKLYVVHMTTHELDRPFKCSLCEATFNYDINRVIHEVLQHHKDPPYTCPICSVESARWFAFKSHLLLHQLEEAVFCSSCPKSFESQCLLDAHIKMEHSCPNPVAVSNGYRCRLCQTHLSTVAKLRQHYRSCHPSELISRRAARTAACELQSKDENLAPSKITSSLDESRTPRLSKSHFRTFMENAFPSKRTKIVTPLDQFIRQLEVEPPTKIQDKLSKRRKKGSCRIVRRAYSCEVCGKKFAKPSTVRRHSIQHTNNKKFQCMVCDMTFAQRSTARSHVQARHQSKPKPSCPFCHRRFFSTISLTNHIRSRHGVTPYGCSPSDRLRVNSVAEKLVIGELQQTDTVHSYIINSSDAAATQHSTYAASEKILTYTCESVTAEVPEVPYGYHHYAQNPGTSRNLEVTSLATRPYKCSLCPKSFSASATLSVHMLRHPISLLPFACCSCPLRFTTSSDLARHVRSHSPRCSISTLRLKPCRQIVHPCSPLKWNSCSHCFLSTRRVRSDRSFKCSLCSRSYRHFIHLKNHIRQSHCPDQAPFECTKCSKRFVNEFRLTRHLNNVHASRPSQSKHKCSICSSFFATISSLKRHMAIHSDSKPYKCHVCHRMFRFYSSCSRHLKTHSSNSVGMPTCSEDKGYFQETFQVIDLDADPHESSSRIALIPTEFTPNLPAHNRRPIDHPKQDCTYTYFTDVQTEACPTTATRYQMMNDTAMEAELGHGTARNWSHSLYDPSVFSSMDGVVICPTNASLTPSHAIVNSGNAGIIVTGHPAPESTHTVSQATGCRSLRTEVCATGVVGSVSATRRKEEIFSSMHERGVHDASTEPIIRRMGLSDGIIDSSNLVSGDMSSTKGVAVSGASLNPCHVNSQLTSHHVPDFTTRSGVAKNIESKQSAIPLLLFGCGVCHSTFDSSHRLATHVQLNHSVRPRPFQCDTCGLCFASETLLIVHKRTHEDVGEKGNFCPLCPLLEFGNKSALTRHILFCHPLPTPDRFRCTHCNTRFRLLSSLKAHVAGLLDAAKQCRDEPTNIKVSSEQLLNGRQKHRRQRLPLVSTSFLRSATQFPQLSNEPLSLSEKYLIDCLRDTTADSDEKAKLYTSEGTTTCLNRNTDEGIIARTKIHMCPTCGRSFTSVSILKHHIRTHLGIRPYKCVDCDKTFTKNCLLQRHVFRAHMNQPAVLNLSDNPQKTSRTSCLVGFRCHLCNRTLLSKNSLRCHVQRHAVSRNYKCPRCQMCFKFWRQRQKHLCDCQGVNTIAQDLPGLQCESTVKDANVGHIETISVVPDVPQVEPQNTMLLVDGGDASVPLVASFLTDVNQAFPLSDNTNLLIPIQLNKGDLPIHCSEWVPPSFSSQLLLPLRSERDTLVSNEVISIVDLSRPTPHVQRSYEALNPTDVVVPPSSVSVSYNETVFCHLCLAKFPDSRTYSKHYCVKAALPQTRFTGNPIQPKLTEFSHRRRHFRPKRSLSPGTGRSFRRLHKCDTCSQEFSQAYLLRRHERTHTNNRPFMCDICGASFSQSYSLTTHSLIHAGARPYACTRCNREFRQKSNLQRHIKLVHPIEAD